MESRYENSQPPPLGARKEVIRVKSTEPQTFVILSPRFYGQWIHWFGNRSLECTKEKSGQCQGCRDSYPSYFKTYLHVLLGHSRTAAFLELTTTASEMIDQQSPAGEPLRGLMVRIGKSKGGAKGRYLVSVLERRLDPEDLPKAEDPLATLRRLWRAKKNPGFQRPE